MLRAFLKDERGQATIDFVVTLLPLMVVVLTVIEVAIAFFVSETSQKAAQLAARFAAVRSPVHVSVPAENTLNPTNGEAGDACFDDDGDHACVDPGGPFVCDGAALDPNCDSVAFLELLGEAQRLYPRLEQEELAVTYAYRNLGAAGGPFIPEITITIAERPLPINFLSMIGLIQLNAVSATAYGEDLSST
ncbi:MAG: TadE/TadG family type IV pilus assembly protein [Pseudomonadota bacterium]